MYANAFQVLHRPLILYTACGGNMLERRDMALNEMTLFRLLWLLKSANFRCF